MPSITLSIVSHGQNALVNQLLEDLRRNCADRVALVLTQNLPDPVALDTARFAGPIEMIGTDVRKGFGANHNAAFARCRTPFFCVCNPDIRLPDDPFPPLIEVLERPRAAVAGPLVRNPAGAVEDSVRRFPTVVSLIAKLFADRGQPDYPVDRGALEVDWIAGMFMLFRADAYRAAGGFDDAYFLYYEDVDICRRLQRLGAAVVFEPRAQVIHDARRASRRNARLALRHLSSTLRFLSRRGVGAFRP